MERDVAKAAVARKTTLDRYSHGTAALGVEGPPDRRLMF